MRLAAQVKIIVAGRLRNLLGLTPYNTVWKIKYTLAKIREAAYDLLMHSCVFLAELDFLTKTCTVLPSTPQASRIALKRHKINKNKVVLASAVPFSKRYLKYS